MLEDFFLRVAGALTGRHITWGLAGGFAFSIYCRPRATVGIDIVLMGAMDTIEIALQLRDGSRYNSGSHVCFSSSMDAMGHTPGFTTTRHRGRFASSYSSQV